MDVMLPFDFAFQNVVLLFFVINLLLFAAILVYRGFRLRHQSDYWLSLLLLISALYITPWMLGHAGWYQLPGYRDFLFYIPFHQYFLFGPAMLFLTRSLTQRDWRLDRRGGIHFIPALLYLAYSLTIAIGDNLIWESYHFYADEMDKDFKPWYQVLGLSSMVVYAAFCIKEYKEYKTQIFQTLSYADNLTMHWLQNFLFALILLILFRALFILIFPSIGDWGFKWWYYLLLGSISCYIGFSGYTYSIRQNELSNYPIPSPIIRDKSTPISLTSTEQQERFVHLQQLMEEQAYYQNPKLSLYQLAQYAGTNTSVLSRIINEEGKMNFNDFVNAYRIKAVKQALQTKRDTVMTLEGLALEAGFNSKSTFLRAFKKSEGMTPSQYKRSLQDKAK